MPIPNATYPYNVNYPYMTTGTTAGVFYPWNTITTTVNTVWQNRVYYYTSGSSYVQPLPERISSPAVIIPETDERKAAIEKAWNLLKDHLNDNQRKSLDEKKFFLVKGGKTGQTYRIRNNGSLVGNIDVLNPDGDKVVRRLCAHGADRHLPHGDQLFIQKVLLEFNEQEFLKVANVHPVH